jgi:hypothetical protein
MEAHRKALVFHLSIHFQNVVEENGVTTRELGKIPWYGSFGCCSDFDG